MYPRDNPKWVQATSVQCAAPTGELVDVVAYGETFPICRVEWSNIYADKSKSDVLVQNSRGDWLRVWFYDADIQPYREERPR
jgi:hypothetical protein